MILCVLSSNIKGKLIVWPQTPNGPFLHQGRLSKSTGDAKGYLDKTGGRYVMTWIDKALQQPHTLR